MIGTADLAARVTRGMPVVQQRFQPFIGLARPLDLEINLYKINLKIMFFFRCSQKGPFT